MHSLSFLLLYLITLSIFIPNHNLYHRLYVLPFEYFSIYQSIRCFWHASLCLHVYSLSSFVMCLFLIEFYAQSQSISQAVYLLFFHLFCNRSFWIYFNISRHKVFLACFIVLACLQPFIFYYVPFLIEF